MAYPIPLCYPSELFDAERGGLKEGYHLRMVNREKLITLWRKAEYGNGKGGSFEDRLLNPELFLGREWQELKTGQKTMPLVCLRVDSAALTTGVGVASGRAEHLAVLVGSNDQYVPVVMHQQYLPHLTAELEAKNPKPEDELVLLRHSVPEEEFNQALARRQAAQWRQQQAQWEAVGFTVRSPHLLQKPEVQEFAKRLFEPSAAHPAPSMEESQAFAGALHIKLDPYRHRFFLHPAEASHALFFPLGEIEPDQFASFVKRSRFTEVEKEGLAALHALAHGKAAGILCGKEATPPAARSILTQQMDPRLSLEEKPLTRLAARAEQIYTHTLATHWEDLSAEDIRLGQGRLIAMQNLAEHWAKPETHIRFADFLRRVDARVSALGR